MQSGCALIGGETAEHPGVMAADDYDLAGFCVGLVDRKDIIVPERIQEGDILLALPSSGLHSNGFSLVRKVFDIEHADLQAYVPELGTTLGEALLVPTKLYVKPVLAAIAAADVHGISHITGGGFYENVPRILPEGYCAVIEKNRIQVPAIFRLLQEKGEIPERDMYNTYNMGVGMVMAVSADTAAAALKALQDNGVEAYEIGMIRKGEEKIELW